MPCSLAEIQVAACLSGIGKEQSPVKLLQLIAQLTCEASEGGGGAGVPSGVILMWSGSIATIPTGWVLCDGSNSTPDLRNRFVVAAQEDDAGVAKTNLTGSLTVSGGSISHAHTVADPGHSHFGGPNGGPDPYGTIGTAFVPTDENPTTTDTTNVTVNAQSAPQPYYALAYIMKT